MPTNGPMNSRQILWLSKFFYNSNNFYFAIWLPKYLRETQLAQFFKFLDSKDKNANNKNFPKKLLHIQKTNTKNFAIPPFLIYVTGCGIIFHIPTIVLKKASATYFNEQNLVVFSRVFGKYFCGLPDTENTPARVQKCFWTNTKKWVSRHNTQSQNTQWQNNQCDSTQCDI